MLASTCAEFVILLQFVATFGLESNLSGVKKPMMLPKDEARRVLLGAGSMNTNWYFIQGLLLMVSSKKGQNVAKGKNLLNWSPFARDGTDLGPTP